MRWGVDSDTRGISPIIGIVLLVSIVVITMSMIGFAVLDYDLAQSESEPEVVVVDGDGEIKIGIERAEGLSSEDLTVQTEDGETCTLGESGDLEAGDVVTIDPSSGCDVQDGSTLQLIWDGGSGSTLFDEHTSTVEIDPIGPNEPYFAVEITETNDPVEEGETLTVDVEVENRGSEADTQDIDIEIADGATVADKTLDETLDEDEVATATLSWDTGSGDQGTYEAIVSSDDDSTQTDVEVTSGEQATLTIPDFSGELPDGETESTDLETVDVTIAENDGVEAEDVDIEVEVFDSDDNSEGSDAVTGETIAANGDETYTFFGGGNAIDDLDADDYDVEVSVTADNAGDTDHTETFSVVEEGQASLEIGDFSDQLPDGETEFVDLEDVDVTIDETADVDAEDVDVEVEVFDSGGDPVPDATDSESVGPIAANGDETVTFFEGTDAVEDIEADDYDVEVTVTADNTDETDHTDSFTVEEETATGAIDLPDEILTNDDEFDVDWDAQSTGEEATLVVENVDKDEEEEINVGDGDGTETIAANDVGSLNNGDTIEATLYESGDRESAIDSDTTEVSTPTGPLYPTGSTVNAGTFENFESMQDSDGQVAEFQSDNAAAGSFDVDILTDEVPSGDYTLEIEAVTVDDTVDITVTGEEDGELATDEIDEEETVEIGLDTTEQQEITVNYAVDGNDDLDVDYQLIEEN